MPRKATGNIRPTPNGGWEVRVSFGTDPRTGKRSAKSKSFPPGTPKATAEAERKRLLKLANAERGKHSRDSVGALLDDYVGQFSSKWTPTTATRTLDIVEHLLKPAFGARRLDQLSTAEIDRYYRRLRETGRRNARRGDPAGLSESSVRRIHSVLHAALELGVKWELLPSNPAARATIHELDEAEHHAPTPEQALKLLAAADAMNPAFGVFIRVSAATGCRRGELCGLLRRDVNDDGTLTIRRVAGLGPDGKVTTWERTKGRHRRVAGIGSGPFEVLRRHLIAMDERALRAGVRLGPDAYVFSNEIDCSEPWRPDSQSARWAKVRAELGLKHVRLHDLRHYAGTMIVELTGNQKLAQAQLGHRHILTTDRYARALPESVRNAVELLGQTLEPGEATG